MVVNGTHFEDPDAPCFEGNNLDDDRQGFEDIEPPAKMSKSSVLVKMAIAAKAPPRAKDPVSPMNILAGCWL